MSRHLVCLSSALLLVATGAFAGEAARKPNAWGYSYPRALDAEVAAPAVHQIHYTDAHVVLMEVSNPPGYKMQMHGHPYPSIFARDTAAPNPGQGVLAGETFMDPKSPRNGQNWTVGGPPQGSAFPTCAAADPQDPHLPVNNSDAPLHFYRLEFKTLDDAGKPAPGRYAKAPERKVLHKTEALQLVEVTIQPGKAESAPNRLPSVVAVDTDAAFKAVLAAAGSGAGRSDPPKGMTSPRCITTAANMGGPVRNHGTVPLHFYRIEYLRLDGPGLKDHWREWYPHMTTMK